MTVEALLADPEKSRVITEMSAKIAREFFNITSSEDLRSEFTVWALAHPQRIERLAYEQDGQPKFNWNRFRQEAGAVMAGVARRDKAAAIGYEPEDEFFYNRFKIQDLLPFVWRDSSYIQDKAGNEKVTTASDPAKGGDRAAEIMDVRRAYGLVIKPKPEWDRVLLCIYGVGWTQDEIAVDEGVSQQAISRRHDRALDALMFRLNGTEPDEQFRLPAEGRKAMSNAEAQSVTSRQEDG